MADKPIIQFEQQKARRDKIQTSISVGEIRVAGDMQGHIIVGNRNVIGNNNVICEINDSHGAVVNFHTPPIVKRRDTTPPPPRSPAGFFGREAELAVLDQAIAKRRAVLIIAHDGIGKTCLAKKAATGDTARSTPDGIVTMKGLDQVQAPGQLDIYQRIFDELYESLPPIKVTASVAQGYLSSVQPLVILDHPEIPPDVLGSIPGMLPQAALVATRQSELFDNSFEAIQLTPPEREVSLQIFAWNSGINLNDDTRPIIDRICNQLYDVPLAIEKIASAVRRKRLAFESAPDRLLSIHPPSQNRIQAAIERSLGLVYSTLNGDEQAMLAFLAVAPGNSVDRAWLESVAGGEQTSQSLMELELVYANSPRLRLPDGLRPILRSGVGDLPERRDLLFRHLMGELGTRSQDFDFVSDELGNILGFLQGAVSEGRWQDVIRLGKAVDPYLTLHGLWDAWEGVLNQVMQAAQTLQDLPVRAWVLHQLGTREIGVGSLKRAINLLLRALELRVSLGDRAGAAHTLHNLNLILPSSDRDDPDKPDEPENPPDTSLTKTKQPESLFQKFRNWIRTASAGRSGLGIASWIVAGILLAAVAALFALTPSLALRKEANPFRYNPIGQIIEYSYTIDNARFIPLPGPIQVTDDGAEVTCPILTSVGDGDDSLDWNESIECSAFYRITPTDVEKGSVSHTARARAGESDVTSRPQTVTLEFDGRYLALIVQPNVEGYRHPGEVIEYTYLVENAGGESLDGPLTIHDDRVDVTCPEINTSGNLNTVLDPIELLTCSGTYTITEEDVSNGTVSHTVSARAGDLDSESITVTVYRILPASSLSLVKSADREIYQDAGEAIHYEYVVTNQGETSLNGPVSVLDDSVEVECEDVLKVGNQDGRLDPGESIRCSATYSTSEEDLERQSVTNTAQAQAGDIPSDPQTTTVYYQTPRPRIRLVKSADRKVIGDAGEVIRYTYTVTNGGSVPVAGPISVTDDKMPVDCPDLNRVGNEDNFLDPLEILTCIASYEISEEDVRTGSVTNTARAYAEHVTSELQTLTIHWMPPSILNLSKRADRATYQQAGEVVRYSYFITNEGRGPISGAISVEDDNGQPVLCPTLETIGDQDNALDPQEVLLCSGQYTISADDIQLGEVTNTARARAGEVTSNPSTVTIHEKALTLTISADRENYQEVGDEIQYSYTITGRSRAPLDSPATILDDIMQVICPDFSTAGNQDAFLDWEETITCNAIYRITQADIDPDESAERGSITNNAVAHVGSLNSSPDSHTIIGPEPVPELDLTNTGQPEKYSTVGEVITFTYVVTNRGNVSLSTDLQFTDGSETVIHPACGREVQMFAPEEMVTCTDTYTILQSDFNYGSSSATNSVTASVDYRGNFISASASATVTCDYPPANWYPMIVAPGENTLSDVMRWYPDHTASDVQKANCMGSLTDLSRGQTLYVPTPPPPTSVSGIIRDTAGFPLPGVRVILRDISGNQIGAAQTTGGDGYYSFTGLQPGTYQIFRNIFTLTRGEDGWQPFYLVPGEP